MHTWAGSVAGAAVVAGPAVAPTPGTFTLFVPAGAMACTAPKLLIFNLPRGIVSCVNMVGIVTTDAFLGPVKENKNCYSSKKTNILIEIK